MDIQFINITKDEFFRTKLLHKYMPLEYALKTLNEKKLWFANPTSWKDPFEKRFIEALYVSKNRRIIPFAWKDRVFCICMTQTAVSEAYWNTYSYQQIGIEFRINKKQLYNELKKIQSQYDIFIGKVEYMKTSDIKKKSISSIPFSKPIPKLKRELKARLLLLKRIAYKYEDEIRIILVKKNKTKEKGINLEYKCKNTDLIKKIILDPSLDNNTTALLKEVFINKYDFRPRKRKGPISRVLKSQLYANQEPQKLTI